MQTSRVEVELQSIATSDMSEMDETAQLVRPERANSCSSRISEKTSKAKDKCGDCGCCRCWRKPEPIARTVYFGRQKTEFVEKYPQNKISNQKYNVFTFLPLVLIEQFTLFTNLYFLALALTQFIPELRISELYTYWGPLGFILSITLIREAVDEIRRWKRDKELNGHVYKVMREGVVHSITSADIVVGDILFLEKNQRVPADVVILRTGEQNGSCFIKTDQLDGEIDWKVKLALPMTQSLGSDNDLNDCDASVFAEAPGQDIHSFFGHLSNFKTSEQQAIGLENVVWASCVVANSSVTSIVIYTGKETRSVLNTSIPHAKIGLLDLEANNYSKMLFVICLLLSFVLVAMKQFSGQWAIYMIRYIVLFSTVIPISLRVNLDMSKIVHSFFIQYDKEIPGTVVRNTTIPEQLARVSILLSDKTGTLTQNVMMLKKLHIGIGSYTSEMMADLSESLASFYSGRSKTKTETRIAEACSAIAVCHLVTPVPAEDGSEGTTYQAASPDEVALVQWTETVGLTLVSRDINSMVLRLPEGLGEVEYTILQLFPFTSESKRMGIIVRNEKTREITFYQKGADSVMSHIVQYADWLDEECGNMAREGLRTLVIGKRVMTEEAYNVFEKAYQTARLAPDDRQSALRAVMATIEQDLTLLGVTGVEDKLQTDVRPTLECVKNAGIKIWMLTGDKMETADCIAKSSRLVGRSGTHIFREVTDRQSAREQLDAFRRRTDCTLVISGASFQVCVDYYEDIIIRDIFQCPSVVICRCSPTMKEQVVKLVKKHRSGQTVAAIGDGGNDVSMIQAADVGLGIVGKEGMQAALAADFSLTQFSHIQRLFLVHGRNAYKSSSSLTVFIFHRGLIITALTIILCSFFYLTPILLFPGFLMVGYSTCFTMFPIFSLVLDKDLNADTAMKFPELYTELQKGRDLSMKRFFGWCFISIYQALAIMILGIIFIFQQDTIHLYQVTFTALILVELIMVGMIIRTWHWCMIVSELVSVLAYVIAIFIFHEKFDLSYFATGSFWGKMSLMVAVACIPLFLVKILRRQFNPPTHSKLQGT